MKSNPLLVVGVLLSIGLFIRSVSGEEVELPSQENFHLYILAGQSNMAGRGKVAEEDRKVHPRVFALGKDGKWHAAVDPLHWDKSAAGVGLGKSFAIALAEKNPKISIGLIPTACGGSPISSWQPGGYHGQTKSHPYDDAIARAKIALEDGTLMGILWHQGESDCKPDLAAKYQEQLTAVIARFRKELDAAELPVVIGQLGKFEDRPWNDAKRTVDAAHQAIAKEDAHAVFVSSEGLTAKSDKIHFNAKSLREFGSRYAQAYLKLSSDE